MHRSSCYSSFFSSLIFISLLLMRRQCCVPVYVVCYVTLYFHLFFSNIIITLCYPTQPQNIRILPAQNNFLIILLVQVCSMNVMSCANSNIESMSWIILGINVSTNINMNNINIVARETFFSRVIHSWPINIKDFSSRFLNRYSDRKIKKHCEFKITKSSCYITLRDIIGKATMDEKHPVPMRKL